MSCQSTLGVDFPSFFGTKVYEGGYLLAQNIFERSRAITKMLTLSANLPNQTTIAYPFFVDGLFALRSMR